MPVPAASGTYREALEAARSLLAGSSSFQSLVGAVDQAAALALIERDQSVPSAGSAMSLPHARVFHSSYTRNNESSSTWPSGGSLEFVITVAPSGSYPDPEDAEAWFMNALGGIVDDMVSSVISGGTLFLRNVRIAEKPRRQGKGDAVACWRGVISADYGVGGGGSAS